MPWDFFSLMSKTDELKAQHEPQVMNSHGFATSLSPLVDYMLLKIFKS